MTYMSILIKCKVVLKQSKLGRMFIVVYHYLIAVPLVKLYSMKFFLIKRNFKKINFYSIDDTFDMLIKGKKSFSRFGDGEISWIYQDSKGYFGQENSAELSRRLFEIIIDNKSNLLIGIPDFFGPMHQYSNKRRESRNAHLAKYYKRWMNLLDEDRVYADALVTRVYNGRKVDNIDYLFKKWKKVWEGRDLILIEGNKTRFGVGNDLLKGANKVRRIIAPSENAFKNYNEILRISKQYISDDVLFLISLGPTATILVYDINNNGGQSIDIGHLDIEYEWYLARAKKKTAVVGKYVNEAGGSPNVELSNEALNQYKSEIIKYIV